MGTDGSENFTPTALATEPLPAPAKTFGRILVAVDDTLRCDAVVRVASKLAAEQHAALGLLNAYDVCPTPPETPLPVRDLRRKRGLTAERLLARHGGHLNLPGGAELLPVEARDVADAITHAARQWQADLIVMGSEGLGHLGNFVFGSVTQAVLRDAPCPVLIVPRQCSRDEPARGAD